MANSRVGQVAGGGVSKNSLVGRFNVDTLMRILTSTREAQNLQVSENQERTNFDRSH